jgi:type IV pilus assembly protein PilV
VRRCAVGGFTLIEVLVALFVVAVGMLGAAAMQGRAQRARTQSALASGAVQLAQALAERMRANRAAMALADASNPYLQLDYDVADGAPAAPPVLCFATGCDPLQLAEHDLYEVRRAIHDGFPGGRVTVCRGASAGARGWDCDHTASSPVVIRIGWQADGAAAPQVSLLAGDAP